MFNPNEHLIDIKSGQKVSQYLPVAWRLVWFRSVCPLGTIETEMVHLDMDREAQEETWVWNNEKRKSEKVLKMGKGIAVFRATVKDGKGSVATGTKSENAASFPDYIEKAETGAIGRALAALGYGTQFAPDLDEVHRIVDSPVERQERSKSQVRPAAEKKSATIASGQAVAQPAQPAPQAPTSDAMATPQQLTSIGKLCERLRKPVPDTSMLTYEAAGQLIRQLTVDYRNQQDQQKAS